MRSSSLVVSVGAHAIVIGLAIFVTARTVDSRQTPPERSPILIYRPAPIEPMPLHPGAGTGVTPGSQPGPLTAPPMIDPGPVPIDLPSAPGTTRVSGADTVWGSGDGSPVGSRPGPAGVRSADMVDVPAAPLPGGPMPRYPDELRAAGIEGHVTLEFVVDSTGRVDQQSVRVIASDAQAFVVSIRDALAGTRYHPALVGGRPVRQLVRQEFAFSLTR